MPTFKDNQGRVWKLQLDAPTILAVRESGDPKFMLDTEQDSTINRLSDDAVLLCGVLFLLCKDERESRKLTDKEFYEGLGGDAIEDATDALLKAILDFTPRRRRELLEVGAAKTEKIRQIAMERAKQRINDPALEEKLLGLVDAELDRLLGLTPRKPATSSPDSSGSIPGD